MRHNFQTIDGIDHCGTFSESQIAGDVRESSLTISQRTILWLIFKKTNSRDGLDDKMGIPESSLDESLQSLTKLGLIERQQQAFYLTPTGYMIAMKTPEEIMKLV
jgi:predicted transcriptional regulator